MAVDAPRRSIARPKVLIDDQHFSNGFIAILKLAQKEFVSGIPRLQRLICKSRINAPVRAYLSGIQTQSIMAP